LKFIKSKKHSSTFPTGWAPQILEHFPNLPKLGVYCKLIIFTKTCSSPMNIFVNFPSAFIPRTNGEDWGPWFNLTPLSYPFTLLNIFCFVNRFLKFLLELWWIFSLPGLPQIVSIDYKWLCGLLDRAVVFGAGGLRFKFLFNWH